MKHICSHFCNQGPERFNNLLKFTKPERGRVGILIRKSGSTVDTFDHHGRPQGRERECVCVDTGRKLGEPEAVLRPICTGPGDDACVTAVRRGVYPARTVCELRAGVCTAGLVKAVGHRNDTLGLLQTFQTA